MLEDALDSRRPSDGEDGLQFATVVRAPALENDRLLMCDSAIRWRNGNACCGPVWSGEGSLSARLLSSASV